MCAKHLTDRCDDTARSLAHQARQNCARCGARNVPLDWSHHLSRRFKSIRWDPTNSTLHCKPCHHYLTNNPFAHVQWIRGFIGDEEYRRLYALAYGTTDLGTPGGPPQFKKADLIEWYELLRREVA
jgi:hypothetical protein